MDAWKHNKKSMRRRRAAIWGGMLLGFLVAVNGVAKTAEDWYREAFELSLEGQQERAMQSYLQALTLKSDWAEAHHALAVLYFRSGQGPQSIDHFRQAEDLYRKRTDSQGKRNLGIVQKSLTRAYSALGLDPKDFERMEMGLDPVGEGQWLRSGLGFLVGREGYLLGADQGLQDARDIRVRLADDTRVPAVLVRSFNVYGIAVLKMKTTSSPPKSGLLLGDFSQLARGDPLYSLNLSQSTPPTLDKGTLLRLSPLENDEIFFQVDLFVEEDEVGGPLFNRSGEVVGMMFSQNHVKKNFARLKDFPGRTGFGVKSSYLRDILSSLPGSVEGVKPSGNSAERSLRGRPLKFSHKARQNLVIIEILQ